jgi:1-acyl-sn-glycerol-3-phosphate acyltransferase
MKDTLGYVPSKNINSNYTLRVYYSSKKFLNFAVKIFFNFKPTNFVELDDKAIILAPLHRSFWDIPIIGLVVDRQCHFMARKEIVKNFLFKKVVHTVGSFEIDRERGVDPKAIKAALKTLKKNRVLVLFPEGTRKKDGSLGDLFPGVARIAQKANCNILPVGMSYEKGRFFRKKVNVEFLKLIETDSGTSDEIMTRLKNSYESYLSK